MDCALGLGPELLPPPHPTTTSVFFSLRWNLILTQAGESLGVGTREVEVAVSPDGATAL